MKIVSRNPGRFFFMKALILTGAALVFAACMMDVPKVNNSGGGELRLAVTTGGYGAAESAARAADSGYGTAFDNGDKIGVTVIKSGAALYDNYPYKYNGGTSEWEPSPDSDGKGTVFIPPNLTGVSWLVYYPYSAGMDGKTTADAIVNAFTVPADQSNQAKYTAADLMMPETGPSLTNNTLSVTFAHKLAMAEIVLPSGSSNVTVTTNSDPAISPWNVSGDTITYRCLVKEGSNVTLSGTYSHNGVNNIAWSKTGMNLEAKKYTAVNVNGDSYSYVTVNYTDTTSETGAYIPSANRILFYQGNGKTIKSVVVNFNGTPKTHLVGRAASSGSLFMKFDTITGDLEFRAAENGYIPIGSYAEFQKINTDAASLGGSYKQEADLDLMEEGWTRVGDNTNKFTGAFDGGGHTIARLKITASSGYQGLFGYIGTGGTIRNTHIASGSLQVTGSDVGVFGGANYGTIEYCSNAATVSMSGTYSYIGGLAGSNRGTITACYNTGAVSGGLNTGGVTGPNYGTITACYNTGAVSGSDLSTGGVAGGNYMSGTIAACYNTGAVSGSTIGGVVGENSNGGTTIACFWLSGIGGAVNGIGSPVSDSESQTQAFGGGNWPLTGTHPEWGIGSSNGTSGNYWKDLGSWNNGSPVYPKLWFEP